jgi:indolepyruvate decarboxylase
VAHARLGTATAAAEIDRVIITSLQERRPGYLVMPTDVAAAPAVPPTAPLSIPAPVASEQVLDAFVSHAGTILSAARTATVLADFLADRFGVAPQLRQLLEVGNFPCSTLSMGKSVLDESDPRFLGIYSVKTIDRPVRDAVEQADALI